VIPMALRGLWGSFFSRWGGTAMRYPRGIFSSIALAIGLPVEPAKALPESLQVQVAELRGAWK